MFSLQQQNKTKNKTKHRPFIIFTIKGATACDFQQCGILTSVDSVEPVLSFLGLETPVEVQ